MKTKCICTCRFAINISVFLQAQEEIADLRRMVMKSKTSQGSKCSVTAQSILKRVEAEREEALTDLHRMSTERDSLRERLKVIYKEKQSHKQLGD